MLIKDEATVVKHTKEIQNNSQLTFGITYGKNWEEEASLNVQTGEEGR